MRDSIRRPINSKVIVNIEVFVNRRKNSIVKRIKNHC